MMGTTDPLFYVIAYTQPHPSVSGRPGFGSMRVAFGQAMTLDQARKAMLDGIQVW